MSKPTIALTFDGAQQVVIWQPCDEHGVGEPALLVQCDATGLLVICQEGREVLIQPETLPELIRQMRRLAAPDQ